MAVVGPRWPGPLEGSRAGWALWYLLHAPRQGRFPFCSPEVVERHQRRRLIATVSHVYRHVPYYRETMRRLGLTPGDFATAADLARLPLLERAEVQRDPELFVSDAQPIEQFQSESTGGSLGEPLTVYKDPFSLVQRAALYQRAGSLHRAIAGRRLGCRTLVIGSVNRPTGSPQAVRKLLARTRKVIGAELRVVSIREPVQRAIEEIERFRPHVVCSFGSYMDGLFAQLHESEKRIELPRLVVYGGEEMSAGARELISDEFGIPVLSVYGAHEAAWVGFECTEHLGIHLNEDLNPIRIVDDGGREVADGETGEVVISNLVNRGTTLLNYRLGDLARKLPQSCPCGRNLPLLSFVEGRVGDWVQTPSRGRINGMALRYLVSDEHEVRRYQIVQRSPSLFTIALIAWPGCDRQRLEARLTAKLVDLLGEGTRVEAEFVDDLPRTAAGKTRAVVGLDRT